jgi:hypothetical protein
MNPADRSEAVGVLASAAGTRVILPAITIRFDDGDFIVFALAPNTRSRLNRQEEMTRDSGVVIVFLSVTHSEGAHRFANLKIRGSFLPARRHAADRDVPLGTNQFTLRKLRHVERGEHADIAKLPGVTACPWRDASPSAFIDRFACERRHSVPRLRLS